MFEDLLMDSHPDVFQHSALMGKFGFESGIVLIHQKRLMHSDSLSS